MKKFWGAFLGTAAAVGLGYLGYKVAKDINDVPEENNDFNKKAKKYFSEKWRNFRLIIDEKNSQIEDVVSKLKDDIISEKDEGKRRELVETASRKIAKLREEIHDTMEIRKRELMEFADNVKQSKTYNSAAAAVSGAGTAIKDAFRKKDDCCLEEFPEDED